MQDSSPLIVVFGATGQQGGAVVRALQEQGTYRIRAITRNAARADLQADEVVEADLGVPSTLGPAVQGAHGVFAVTNFWEPGTDEIAQARALIDAAKQAGVRHFVWSTLPYVEAISEGTMQVPHFTNKAKVDALVTAAGFEFHTFVEAPSYYQNLTGSMGPTPMEDGTRAWTVPIDPAAEVVHMGDITELGGVVAGAFLHAETVGQGQHLALAGDRMSWDGIVQTLCSQGHRVAVRQVPPAVYDGFFPGAPEIREMMQFFEAYTYFGPDADRKIALANQVSPRPPTGFAEWAAKHMPAEE